MEKRVFIVLDNDPKLTQVASKLASDLVRFRGEDSIAVAKPESRAGEAIPDKTQLAAWPASLKNDSEIRNWLNSLEIAKSARWLHVVKGSTELLRDPSEFITQLEKTMDVLDYSFWLSTVCDPCNYLYSKFCPREIIDVDDPKHAKLGLPNQLLLTSHSNLQWVAYDMAKATQSELCFDPDFSVAMYEIVEALARRKAGKTSQPYFMNQYVTVPAEVGVFQVSNLAAQPQQDPETMKREDKIFQSKKLAYAADNAVDSVMAAIRAKLDEKAA